MLVDKFDASAFCMQRIEIFNIRRSKGKGKHSIHFEDMFKDDFQRVFLDECLLFLHRIKCQSK